MDKVVILHSQPKSKNDFKLLSLSNLVISFILEDDLSADLKALLSNKITYLNDQEIYDARERSKEIWNAKIIKQISIRKNLLFTNSGTSRSEFSTAIQAFHVWNVIEKHLDIHRCYVETITENKDLICIAKFHNKAFISVHTALLKSVIHSIITTIKRLAIDSFYFFVLKSKRVKLPSQHGSHVAFSLIKHWSDGKDWRYGDYFCKNYQGTYVVSCMRAGGLQNHKYFYWNKLVDNCLRKKNTFIIESLVTWRQFFRSFFSVVKLYFGLFIRTLNPFLLVRNNLSCLDILLLLEENKHFSEMFSNQLIYYGSTNLFKKSSPEKAISYHFEFPAGRAFISAARKNGVSEMIGLQHGVISKGKWCYELSGMMSNDSLLDQYTPQLYLLEGIFSWWVLSKVIDAKKIKLVGAPRQDSFQSLVHDSKSTESHHVNNSSKTVLLMDLHTTSIQLIGHIEKILKEMDEVNQVYIRPHPRDLHANSKIEEVKMTFSRLNFECLTNTLQTDIKKIEGLIVWGESTGALLDCMGLGINVKVLRSREKLILDPILDIQMNLDAINNFILKQGFKNYSSVSDSNPKDLYNLLFQTSNKHSSAEVLDCFEDD